MNLARKHYQQHQAKSAAESAAEFGTMQNTNAYEQQLMQLNSDKSSEKYSVRNKTKSNWNASYYQITNHIFKAF